MTKTGSYERLIQVLDKVFTQSRASIDLNSIIEEIYGEDKKIFGDDDMLRNVLETLLETLQSDVTEDMKEYFVAEDIPALLRKFDLVVQKIEREDLKAQLEEESDKKGARQALQQTQLPAGMTPNDLIKYRTYQKMQEEQERMKAEVAALQEEIKQIEAKNANCEESMKRCLNEIQTVGQELEKSADICSMVS